MRKSIIPILSLALCAAGTTDAFGYEATQGLWTLEISDTDGTLNIRHGGKVVFNDAYATVTYNKYGSAEEKTISSLNAVPEITVEDANDCFGQGKTYVMSYNADGAVMRHTLSFYSGLPYMIAQVSVKDVDGAEVQSRSLTALAVNKPSLPLNGASNRVVWVPFDNDGHLKYEIFKLEKNEEMTSHEVSYVFDGESRRGIVAGSVDHDTWKSGVTISGTSGCRIEKFECLSGFTDFFSRDALPHGKVKGTTVSSARFFVGVYDDWREGLNDFGEANTKVVPKAPWAGGNPMGWSSWGVQQNYINYDGVVESARFLKEQLFNLGFHNKDGQTVISLDSFAGDNISSANIYKLGTKVLSDGKYKDGKEVKEGTNQILGEYCGPFVVWDWTLDSKVPGTGLNGSRDYTYRDMALKVNGDVYKVPSNGGLASDPTHPAVRANIAYFMKQFATNGTKYIKVDFLNNGILEGDSWYDPTVTTGVQAYNYGMKMLYEEAEKYGMYIVESISPIFPYQYAHGRRTCCDRFSEIGESEYVMNAISYGWWTDRLYTVNDPDQLVMCKGGHGARETLGENRARATSGMCTGAYIFGDNFSDKAVYTDDKDGHVNGAPVGYPEESRTRALTIMGNSAINEYVRNNTGSFMPVEGHKPSSGQSSESIFMRRTADAMYVAVFNWNKLLTSKGSITLSRLGLDVTDAVDATELWSGKPVDIKSGAIDYSIPAKDVYVYRITLKDQSGIDEITADAAAQNQLKVRNIGNGVFELSAGASIASCRVYDITGRQVSVVNAHGTPVCTVNLCGAACGMYIINAVLSDGLCSTARIYNR